MNCLNKMFFAIKEVLKPRMAIVKNLAPQAYTATIVLVKDFQNRVGKSDCLFDVAHGFISIKLKLDPWTKPKR